MQFLQPLTVTRRPSIPALFRAAPEARREVEVITMQCLNAALEFVTGALIDQHVIAPAETCRTVRLGCQKTVGTGRGFPVPDPEAIPLNTF